MKNKLILFMLAIFAVGCFGVYSASSPAKADSNNYNKTLTVQSGYESAFFAPVSPLFDYKGATVEFDLYKSNFKDLNYNKSYDVMSFSGTSGSLASVNFIFGKVENYPYSNSPSTPAWHIEQITEYNFGGFQYFCNGQIKEWSDRGNFRLISEYVGTPEEFMEEGYSYKVSLTYKPFTYKGKQYGGNQEWFCVERKGIFEEESAYEVLFAYQKQIDAARFNEKYTNGTMAGMEIQGLCMKANISGAATSADGLGHSVELELDNMRIYDGTSYQDAAIRYAEDFETVTANMVYMPPLMQAGASICKFDGENHLELPSGIRFNAINYSNAIGRTQGTTAQLGILEKELYNVTFKDASSGETVATTKTCAGLDFSGTRIYSGNKVYKFDYSNIDFDSVNDDLVVYGTPVSYFTLTLRSGIQNVNDKVIRVPVDENYRIPSDILVRQDYDLVGFSIREGDTNVQYETGSVVNMNCRDKTIYAVWKMKSYQTEYYSGKVKLYSVTTKPGEVPYYGGATPQKAGYVFAGWSESIAPSQSKTLSAQFVEIDDVYAENKALAVNGRVKFIRERSDSAANVDITFDLVSLPQGAQILVMGKDITEYAEQGYRIKVTITSAGNITVSRGYIDCDKFTYVGSTQTGLNTRTVSLELKGNAVIDTLAISYDGENLYEENFDGNESFAEGIYNNYYAVEGDASVISLPRGNVVTFTDEATGRTVSELHVYSGGNVALPDSIEGVTSAIVWDKTQSELLNVTGDISVKANLTWQNCELKFDTSDGVFGLIELTETLQPISGIYGQIVTLPTIEFENYEIVGWTDVKGGGYIRYENEFELTKTSQTLYPIWGGKIYTVEFYAEDGTTLLERQNAEYNATVIFGGEIPVKEGYNFVGWDVSTVGISGDTKFTAVYEKALRSVTVSVLGGEGAGKYTEGDTVTIAYRDIKGYKFDGFRVVSGGVTISDDDGIYTFVVGDEDVVIEAVVKSEQKANTSSSCGASVSAQTIGSLVLICFAFIVLFGRRNKYNEQ